MSFNQVSVAQRLGLGFATMLLMLVFVSAAAIWNGRVTQEHSTQSKQLREATLHMKTWAALIEKQFISTRLIAKFAHYPDLAAEQQEQIAQRSATINELQQASEEALARLQLKDAQAQLDRVIELRLQQQSARRELFGAVGAADAAAIALSLQRWNTVVEQFKQAHRDLVAELQRDGINNLQSVKKISYGLSKS